MPPIRKRSKRPRLPRKLLAFKSNDKDFIEAWSDIANRDPLNFPLSYRLVATGKPGAGKTRYIKNVVARRYPRFERIYVMHADPLAQEYDDLDCEMLSKLPPTDFWLYGVEEDDTGKEAEIDPEEEQDDAADRPATLVILDDICWDNYDKTQLKRLDRLCGMVSTHANVSVIITAQDVFAVPAIVRKCADIWVLWRPTDLDEFGTIGRRVGIKKKDLLNIFDTHCPTPQDNLTIDLTHKSPYPLRINGYTMIQRVET